MSTRSRSPVKHPAVRIVRVLSLVACMLSAALVFGATGWRPLLQHLLAPTGGSSGATMPRLQEWALEKLARSPEQEDRLFLVRLMAVTDPEGSPEAAARLAGVLLSPAGLPTTAEQGLWSQQASSIYRWASDELDLPLDAHGGLLGSLPLGEKFREAVEAIGSRDVHQAWLAWETLGVGDLLTPEQWLWELGPALADPRPIHFAIRRGSLSSAEIPFEGQPTPIQELGEQALATTIGEALALRLWSYQGVGAEKFPEDFWLWWDEWSRSRFLPPRATR